MWLYEFLIPWASEVSTSAERRQWRTGGGKGKTAGTAWHVHTKNFWGSDSGAWGCFPDVEGLVTIGMEL